MQTARTLVVNIKHDDYDINIGRSDRHRGLDRSIFANPYPITNKRTRQQSMEMYRKWFYNMIECDESFKHAVDTLRGKRLGCWCHPKPCHGDIIVEYLGDTWF